MSRQRSPAGLPVLTRAPRFLFHASQTVMVDAHGDVIDSGDESGTEQPWQAPPIKARGSPADQHG